MALAAISSTLDELSGRITTSMRLNGCDARGRARCRCRRGHRRAQPRSLTTVSKRKPGRWSTTCRRLSSIRAGKLQAILRIEPADLPFGDLALRPLRPRGSALALAALDRLFQPLSEVHGYDGRGRLVALSATAGFSLATTGAVATGCSAPCTRRFVMHRTARVSRRRPGSCSLGRLRLSAGGGGGDAGGLPSDVVVLQLIELQQVAESRRGALPAFISSVISGKGFFGRLDSSRGLEGGPPSGRYGGRPCGRGGAVGRTLPWSAAARPPPPRSWPCVRCPCRVLRPAPADARPPCGPAHDRRPAHGRRLTRRLRRLPLVGRRRRRAAAPEDSSGLPDWPWVRGVPGGIIVSDTRRRCLSTSSTHTLTMSPTATIVVRIADVLVGHLADVHQAAVVHADVDEGPEIDDVEHRAGQFHARAEVFQLEHALFEHGRGQIFARIASRTDQLRHDVLERQHAHFQLFGHLLQVDLGDRFGQGGAFSLSPDRPPCIAELRQHAPATS